FTLTTTQPSASWLVSSRCLSAGAYRALRLDSSVCSTGSCREISPGYCKQPAFTSCLLRLHSLSHLPPLANSERRNLRSDHRRAGGVATEEVEQHSVFSFIP